MAYLPPHKRHSNSNHPTPTPASLPSSFKSLSLSSHPRGAGGGRKIVHAAGCISRWWPTPPLAASGDGQEELRLEPFACEAIERKGGGKPLALVSDGGEEMEEVAPWVGIAGKVLPDLVAAVGRARGDGGEEVKLSLVSRVGKVLFHAAIPETLAATSHWPSSSPLRASPIVIIGLSFSAVSVPPAHLRQQPVSAPLEKVVDAAFVIPDRGRRRSFASRRPAPLRQPQIAGHLPMPPILRRTHIAVGHLRDLTPSPQPGLPDRRCLLPTLIGAPDQRRHSAPIGTPPRSAPRRR